MKNFMKLAAAAALLSAAAAVPAYSGVSVGIVLTPPAPRYEVQPVRPWANAVWVQGHWGRRYGQWVWVRGHWARPYGRYTMWVPGHYDRFGVWIEGHWR